MKLDPPTDPKDQWHAVACRRRRVSGEKLLLLLLEGRQREEVEHLARRALICRLGEAACREDGRVVVYRETKTQELEADGLSSRERHVDHVMRWLHWASGGRRIRNLAPQYVDDDNPGFAKNDPHDGRKIRTKTSLDSEEWVEEDYLRAADSPHRLTIMRGTSDRPVGRPRRGVRAAEVIELAIEHAKNGGFTLEEMLATLHRGKPREYERAARAALADLVATLTTERNPIHVGTLAEHWGVNQATLYRLRKQGRPLMRKNLPRGGEVFSLVEAAPMRRREHVSDPEQERYVRWAFRQAAEIVRGDWPRSSNVPSRDGGVVEINFADEPLREAA